MRSSEYEQFDIRAILDALDLGDSRVLQLWTPFRPARIDWNDGLITGDDFDLKHVEDTVSTAEVE